MNFIRGDFESETMVGILTNPPTDAEQNITEFREYYAGRQNVKLTARQKEYLKCDSDMANAFVNISKMVPSVILDRLSIVPNGRGIIAADQESQGYADQTSDWWIEGGLDKFSSDLHKLLLRDGAAAMFVEWIGDRPIFTPKPIWTSQIAEGVRFHSEANAIDVEYDFASYQWPVRQYTETGEIIADTLIRLNVYAKPDREDGGSFIYRYKSNDGDSFELLTEEEIESELGILTDNPQELEISRIPIVKFVNTDQLSEIADVFRLQQLINKSVGDIDIGSDFQAYPLLAAEDFPKATAQKVAPNTVMIGKGVKRIEAANIEQMWRGTVLPYVDMVSLVKRWPMWLLNPRDFSVPSGTALRVAERPLVSQIREKQNSLSPQWRLAFDIARDWQDAFGEALAGDIVIKWESAATEAVIEDQAMQVTTAKEAGLPDETIWRDIFGLSSDQIDGIFEAQTSDIDHRQQQATIVEILSGALVDISAAAEFAGLDPEAAQALATFGNAEPRGTDGEDD